MAANASLVEVIEAFLSLPRTRVKAGGYPEDIFLDLPGDWRDKWECSICYLVLKDPRQCQNGHKYCWCCIHVWSVTGVGDNHALCPVCRAEGFYKRSKQDDEDILRLRVKCSTSGCDWTGCLSMLKTHTHTFIKTSESSRSPKSSTTPQSGLPVLRRRGSVSRSSFPVSTATGLQVPDRRYPLFPRNASHDPQTTANVAPSSTSLPDITIPPGVRSNPSYASSRLQSSNSGMSTQDQQRSRAVQHRHLERRSRRDDSSEVPNVSQVRRRLDESRDRLQSILLEFGQRLSRNEQDAATFHEQRERRRQQQLEEVRQLGVRLGEVAAQLRTMFNPEENNQD